LLVKTAQAAWRHTGNGNLLALAIDAARAMVSEISDALETTWRRH
jgi:hypothetical protein